MLGWVDLFALTTPLLELFVRGTLVFLALIVALRIVGQREVGGLGLTDLLVVVLVVEAAGVGLRGEATSVGDSAVLVVTVLAWSVAVDAMSYRWPRISAAVKARPKAIIRDGEFDRHVLHREFMTRDEVLSQLRLHGITDPSTVHRAYIEPNGMVSVIRRDRDDVDEVPSRPAV